MKIVCEHCGEDNLLPIKKLVQKRGKNHRTEYCQNCGSKIIIPIIKRYSDDEYQSS
jgi:hypothetical protein